MTSARSAFRQTEVLHILGPVRRSGAEMMLLNAATALRAAGAAPGILSLGSTVESTFATAFSDAGYEVRFTDGVGAMRLVPLLFREVRHFRPGCVHVHAESRSLLTSLVPRLLGVRVVRTVHNSFQFSGALRQRKRLERWLQRGLGVRFITIAPSVSRNERERFGNHSQEILNWYADDWFRMPTAEEREVAREAFGVRAEDRVLAIVGNCSWVKRHELLLEALSHAGGDIVVLHAGAGDATSDEKEIAAERGLGSRLRFLPPEVDVREVFFAADLYVMTSRYEGLSLAAIEASATGLQLVVVDVQGLRDLVQWFPDIRIAPPEARALAEELAAANWTDRMGAAAVARAASARANFGMERGVAEYCSAYGGRVR
jgi:glycosyltransferase involved in cell wall biosynthesis